MARENKGDKYEGQWENDMKHGQGTMTTVLGFETSGIWKNNEAPLKTIIFE